MTIFWRLGCACVLIADCAAAAHGQQRRAPPVFGAPVEFTPWYAIAISLEDAPAAGVHMVDVRYAHRELGSFMHRELLYQFRNRYAVPVSAVYEIEYTPIPGDTLTGTYDGPTYRERHRFRLGPGEIGPELSVRGIGRISSIRIREARSRESPAADSADRYGYTELMKAARRGSLERVRELLQRGSDPNRQANDGYTALMFAANGGFEPIVRMLLDAHADPNLRNDGGYTALGLLGTSFPEIERLLRQHGGVR